jgi:hypothetical protein
MKWIYPLVLIVNLAGISDAQITQTVRGKVAERETQFPIPGATVILLGDSAIRKGASTDAEGFFQIEKVPVGRQALKISFIGYEDVILNNVIVTSAKEVVLEVLMKESVTQLENIVVTATRDGDPSNEMALVSVKSFSIEETERYAGSRGDPARMASNFAGVQGADDSRNDIVIRGNSPQAVLWRMEGINIPNPNHFNIPGTAGGPVSMINNKTLANSDFYTGAFPAEFGNSISGVFDLKLRNGNNQKHEYSGQFGFLGTELFAEGPFTNAKKSSYLFSYRYSTLAIFSKIGIDIGTSAVPRYQDIAFKMNFPLKKNGSIALFALGGNSRVDILVSQQKQSDRNIYGENDRDQYFRSSAGIIGVCYKQPLRAGSYLMASVALSGEQVRARHEYVEGFFDAQGDFQVTLMKPVLRYVFQQNKASGTFFYAKKISRTTVLNAGVNNDLYFFDFLDSARTLNKTSPAYDTWRVRWNSRESALLWQPFVQMKFQLSSKTEMTAGIHSQYFSLSNSFVLFEPRWGLKHRLSERSAWDIGFGLHSQIQPTYLYFYGSSNDATGAPILLNNKMGFTRSAQAVSGYQYMPGNNVRLKTEIYYQYLFDIPIDRNISSSFSLVNTGAGFSRFFPDQLTNEGMGKNYGIEATVEKFFSQGYLFLFTGSLFEAKYKGSDQVWRDTDFNGNYIFNALFSREWQMKNKNIFALGGKVTTAGGRRYGPVDETASEEQKDIVYVNETRNSLQFNPYFRADLRLNYKINRPRVTHEIALDLVNVFDTKNILKLTYVPRTLNNESPIKQEYQLGFLPLFYYRLDF